MSGSPTVAISQSRTPTTRVNVSSKIRLSNFQSLWMSAGGPSAGRCSASQAATSITAGSSSVRAPW